MKQSLLIYNLQLLHIDPLVKLCLLQLNGGSLLIFKLLAHMPQVV